MKLIAQVILLSAFVAAVLGLVPTPPSHCDYKCEPADVAVYATNGRCYLKFPNQCSVERFNCLNPQKAFRLVSKLEYSADSAPRCHTKDY